MIKISTWIMNGDLGDRWSHLLGLLVVTFQWQLKLRFTFLRKVFLKKHFYQSYLCLLHSFKFRRSTYIKLVREAVCPTISCPFVFGKCPQNHQHAKCSYETCLGDQWPKGIYHSHDQKSSSYMSKSKWGLTPPSSVPGSDWTGMVILHDSRL